MCLFLSILILERVEGRGDYVRFSYVFQGGYRV